MVGGRDFFGESFEENFQIGEKTPCGAVALFLIKISITLSITHLSSQENFPIYSITPHQIPAEYIQIKKPQAAISQILSPFK